MANVLQCHPIRQPTGVISGSKPNVYNAQWVIELDDVVDMKEAVELATKVAVSPTVSPLPPKGSFYNWVARSGATRSRDKSALALDFEFSELLDDGLKWIINVRWRAPVPGAEEEFDRVNVDPVKRKPYYWVEYYTETEEMFDARPTIPLGIVGKVHERPAGVAGAGPITTAAGEEVDIAVDEHIHIVLVCERNVLSPIDSIIINGLYFGKLNSVRWTVPGFRGGPFPKGFRIEKHHARFLRAETSQYGKWFDGGQYFKMQIRVRVNPLTPFYKQVPNRGTLRYDSGSNKVILNRDSDGVLVKTNLTQQGAATTVNKPLLIPYQIAGERTFGPSIGFV